MSNVLGVQKWCLIIVSPILHIDHPVAVQMGLTVLWTTEMSSGRAVQAKWTSPVQWTAVGIIFPVWTGSTAHTMRRLSAWFSQSTPGIETTT